MTEVSDAVFSAGAAASAVCGSLRTGVSFLADFFAGVVFTTAFFAGGAPFFAATFAGLVFEAGTVAFFAGALFAGAAAVFATMAEAAALAAFLLFAQRFFCAAAMRAFPSSLMVRFPAGFASTGFAVPGGRPRRFVGSAEGVDVDAELLRSWRACCS